MKQHVPEIKDLFYESFAFNELFEDEAEYNEIADIFGTYSPMSINKSTNRQKEIDDQSDTMFIPYHNDCELTTEPLVFDFIPNPT